MDVKYNDLGDIPACKHGDQPSIDLDNLWQYSIKILKAVCKELDQCIAEAKKDAKTRNPLQYPGTMADEEGMRSYVDGPLIVAKDYEAKKQRVLDEMNRRKSKK